MVSVGTKIEGLLAELAEVEKLNVALAVQTVFACHRFVVYGNAEGIHKLIKLYYNR